MTVSLEPYLSRAHTESRSPLITSDPIMVWSAFRYEKKPDSRPVP